MIVLSKDNDTPMPKDTADGQCGICGERFAMHPMRNNFYCDATCAGVAYSYYHRNPPVDNEEDT